MKNIISKVVVAMLICMLPQLRAVASSHREAPLISMDPQSDNTDLYVFRSPTDSTKVIIIANYIPFEHPAGGPNWYNFGQNIRYEIHIKNKTTTTGDDIVYRFTFNVTNQDTTTFFNIRLGKQNTKATYTCQRSMDGGATFTTIKTNGIVPPLNIGPRSIESGVGLSAAGGYDSLMMSAITTASTGEKLFCGPIDDPFFVDLGGAFDVGGFRLAGKDGLAKFNCHTIALEIPIATLQKDGLPSTSAANILDPNFVIGVWASASRPAMTTLSTTGGQPTTSGAWIQISRLGMPLTNEVVIPIGSKDGWNRANPYTDDLNYAANFKNPELALYMDASLYGGAVPGLDSLRIQSASLGSFDFRNNRKGLWPLKGSSAVAGTALDDAAFGTILLPDSTSPRAVDLLPIFYTGVPNVAPYQLATGKGGNPLAAGKPFINNFLPTLCDMIRLNMAVPTTSRTDPNFSSLGLVSAAVLGLTNATYNSSSALQFIPNMDGFPNGRRLEDDVTTIELQAVSGVVLAAIGLWYDDYTGGSPVTADLVRVLSFNAGVTHNDTTFKTTFPFVQDPWRGFTGDGYTGPLSYTYHNVAPAFTSGTSQTLSVCMNAPATSINSQLEVVDSNYNQTLTWITMTGCAHGYLVTSYTATSNGGVVTPTGLTYTPTAGYSGTDSFRVKVSDGTAISIVTIHVTIGSIPAITGASSVCVSSMATLMDVTTGGTWISSNTSLVTIDATTGIATGVAAGSATITYTAGTGCSRTTPFTVKALPAAIAGATSFCIGGTGVITDPTSGGMSWMSSNPSVATIGSASGLITGIAAGTTTMTFTLTSGCIATTTVTVNASASAIMGTSSICAGTTTSLSSADMGGTWSSSGTTIASVNAAGLVSGLNAGAVNITYSLSGGCRAIFPMTINASPAAIGGSTSICTGSTTALTDATTGGMWTSSDGSIASVSSTGVVTGVSTGAATISYANGTCARTVTVNVSAGSAAISGSATVCPGMTSLLTSAATGGAWSTSSGSVATVSAGGLVTGVNVGTSRISYTVAGGCSANVIVTVIAAPAVITGGTFVCMNSMVSLSDATAGGMWSSSNMTLGTIDATTGVLTGLTAGTTVISYSVGTCYRTLNVTVRALPVPISGNLNICVGSHTNVTDASPTGLAWSTSTPSVATIGTGSGVVIGVSVGTTTITYLNNTGCTRTAVVTVNPMLTAGTISGPASVSLAGSMGSPVAYTDGVTGGTWTSSNTARATIGSGSGLLTGVSAGALTVSYTVTNSCGTARATQMVTITTPRANGGLTGDDGGELIRLFPNPTSGTFNLQTPTDGTLAVYTLEGKQLDQYQVKEGTNTLTLPRGIATGIYMCKYVGNDGSTLMIRLVYEQ